MNIQKLTHDELLRIYGAYSPLYFPSNELKPVSTVEWLLEKQIYHAYGFYDKEQLLAYACMIQIPGHATVLLDYYAVLEQYRSSGIGGLFLQQLTQTLCELDGIYIESENPDYALDEADKELRLRRIAFYEKNGAYKTGLLSCLFDVDYCVLFLPCAAPAALATEDHYSNLDAIYLKMFPAKHYAAKVRITKP